MKDLLEILKFYRELGVEFIEAPASVNPPSLLEVTTQIMQCQACGLAATKTHYVPGEGAVHPEIVFVGEGPGETEDQFGRPFIGKAGQLLDRVIEKMGFDRAAVFITNVVKCRPPNNREPLPDEVAACLPHLQRQLACLQPKVIVCLGKVALNSLIGDAVAIGKARGQVYRFGSVPVVPTYHPAYILHKKEKQEISQAKWEVWEDMQVVLTVLGKMRP
jgi:uracil-DNA glycosylase